MKKIIMAALMAVGVAFGVSANTTITFDALPGPNGSAFAGPYFEGGFGVTAEAGDVFSGQVFGSPVPSLVVGSVFGGSASATVRVTGNTFILNSFDLASQGVGTFMINGFLGGNSVFSFGGNLSGPQAFSTFAGMGGNVDTVDFVLTNVRSSSINLDNIVLGAVPEPATWLMMIIGFATIGAALRRRQVVTEA